MLAALLLSALVAAAPSPHPRPGEPVEEHVHQNSLVGTLEAPAEAGRQPAVIILGGAEGGIPVEAFSFAEQGYAGFAVAYFGAPPLGKNLDEIPVETVSRAIDYLAGRPDVDPARIGVLGISEGSALALLSAARDPRIKSVAVVSPTAYVWFARAFDGRPDRSSWTRDNVALPFIPPDRHGLEALSQAFEGSGTFAFRDLYDPSLAAAPAATVAQATIPVERIGAPVLCVAGDDDRDWDSAGACKTIATRRHAAGRDGRDQVAIEPGAGHAAVLGGRAWPDVVPAGRMKFRFGGTPEANQRAGADTWTRTLTFFARTL